MNRSKKISALLLTTALIFTFAAFSVSVEAYEEPTLQNRIVREYNETNGLPTGEANTVLQTSDGYMWIGSYGGLIRYDGTTFRNYSDWGGIESSSIRALYEDSNGRLWVGTNDLGVYLFENNEFTLLSHADRTQFLSVRTFAEDNNGTVYAGTTSGLAKVENGSLVPVTDELLGMTVYNIVCDKNGALWICLDDGIAAVVKGGKVIYRFDSSKFTKSPLYCMGSDNSHNIYIGTSDKYIYRLDLKDGEYTDDSFSLTEYATGNISTFNAVCEGADGNIWAAALNGVGYIDEDGDWHEIAAEHTSAANALAFDYEGNVWIASSSYGVIQLIDGLYYDPNEKAGLSETSINVVKAASDGNYYIGTDTGLIILDKDFSKVTNDLTNALDGDRVRNILCDSKGNIWIGTYYNNGLVLYDPKSGEFTSFTQEEGMTDTRIRMILELSDGSIAASTQNGVNILKDKKVVQTYTEENGLSYPIILCLCEGRDGTLYAGSDGQGFYAIKDGNITQYGFEQGLTAGVVLRMIQDTDTDGLFISAGNNLYYWDGADFRMFDNYPKSAGSIFDIAIVDDQLWLMQSNGINILDKAQLMSGKDTPVNVVGTAYGLSGTMNANTWNDLKDGVMYLCTSNGISLLNTSDLQQTDSKIAAVISRVTADDKTFEAPASVVIDGQVTRLTFYFAPLSFSGRDVTVRYQLLGFDDKAYTALNDRELSASYTNLSGGDYQFCLEVLAPDGETVLNTVSIAVHKNYMAWERPWFWILMAVAFLLVVLAVVVIILRVKTESLKHRQQEYRDIINQAMRTFANTIDAKDEYTKGHSERVARYTLEIAKKLKMSPEDQERIYYIALLHDIGKIGIPDYILNKPGKLTPEERKLIMQHPTFGGEILKDFTSLPGISDGARYHHERYDGKGYNEGLKGEEIPYFARIICVADSYDAMSSVRCYQGNMDTDLIVDELKEGSGTQFDPKIVDIMLELIKEGKVPCMDLLPKPYDPQEMFKK